MPLASASPLRSVAIGAGVGGKVSHRSAARDGKAAQAMNAARANWRMSFSAVRSGELFAFPAFMQTGDDLGRQDAPITGRRYRTQKAPKSMPNPFFTIGHSTRSIDEFAALLTSAAVKLVV